VGLLLLGATSLLSGEESIKWCTFYLPNNVADLSVFRRKKVGALS